jgi:phosphoglycolate phosphatase
MRDSLNGATIAFDLDGTLVDTAPDLIGALNVVLGECRLPHLPADSARHLVGRGARRLIEKGFAEAGEPLDPDRAAGLTTRFIEVYRSRIANESRPFPGVFETLDELAQAGATLCVCTNKLTDLSVELLDALGLTSRFAAVIGADKTPAIKPDPRHIMAAVEAAGGDPNRALMVGDSHNDVAAAKASGTPVVVVSFGYTETPAAELGGDVVIDRYADLPAAAERLLGGA